MINEAFHNICPIFCRPIWHRERGNLPPSFFSFILLWCRFICFSVLLSSCMEVFLEQAIFSLGSDNSSSHLSSLSISLSLSLSRATHKISWFPEMLQNVGRGSLNDWCKRLNGGSSCDLSTRQSTEAHHWISGTLSVSSWFRHDCLLFRFFSFHFHFHFLHFLFLSDPFQL